MNRFQHADWDGLYRFFASGNPPLALQLLALNTVFFVLYLFHNARAKHPMRRSSAQAVQGLLIAANVAVLFRQEALNWVKNII
jgi:hypothetical protein